MKKCCSGLAVVLVSLVAFGVGHAQIDFHGVLNPNGHSVWLDTAIVTSLGTDTILTPGWGSDSVAFDSFDFPDLFTWPSLVVLRGHISAERFFVAFPAPGNGVWYDFRPAPPPPPAPRMMFWSLLYGIGAEPEHAARQPELQVVPSMLVDRATVRAQVAGHGPVRLEIVDAAGNRVRSLGTSNRGGVITQVWLGDDDAGRSLPEGVYFCRLAVGEAATVRKVLLAR